MDIFLEFVKNNQEVLITNFISLISVIVSIIVAKKVLEKELRSNREQKVRSYKNEFTISQIDNLINLSSNIINKLNELQSLELSNEIYYYFKHSAKINSDIKKYDYFRKFLADYRLKTLIKAKEIIESINFDKQKFKLLEDTIEVNKIKFDIELPDFNILLEELIEDVNFCQDIILDTNVMERSGFTTDEDRIKYMSDIFDNFNNDLAKEKINFNKIYINMLDVISKLYKLKPVISEFIIDFEED